MYSDIVENTAAAAERIPRNLGPLNVVIPGTPAAITNRIMYGKDR
jgi:hypothetical protein